jgi:hypothetical protein
MQQKLKKIPHQNGNSNSIDDYAYRSNYEVVIVD